MVSDIANSFLANAVLTQADISDTFYSMPFLFEFVKRGRGYMIIYDKLWETMKEKGFSTYRLREQCGIDSKTIRRLRANENIETKTLDKLCQVLDCSLDQIATYIKN